MDIGTVLVVLISFSGVLILLISPFWMIMHYVTKRHEAKTLLNDEEEALGRLLDAADRMEQRIDSLEKILETEDPNWKEKHNE